MFLRTTVSLAIFSQEDDEDLLVEMRCVEGDRGAFQKLCEYIVQRCGLRHITDSDPFSVSYTHLLPLTQECITCDLEGQINVSSETTSRSRSDIMSTPTRAVNAMFSMELPGSPPRLHLHDSYAPLPFPAKKLPGFANEHNNTRQNLRMLVKRQARAKEIDTSQFGN